MCIFKTLSCITHFTDLQVTSFGSSVKQSSFVYGDKVLVWPLFMNIYIYIFDWRLTGMFYLKIKAHSV